MKLISEPYRRQNRLLHESPKKYGQRGHRHLDTVKSLMDEYGCNTVLDYGCGKADLSKHADFPVQNYDPAIPEYERLPESADLVVCTDVLEHIEENLLSNVLLHLFQLTLKAAYLCIATRPDTSKTLPDGSNPHKIIEEPEWWIQKVQEQFQVKTHWTKKGEVYIVCVP